MENDEFTRGEVVLMPAGEMEMSYKGRKINIEELNKLLDRMEREQCRN